MGSEKIKIYGTSWCPDTTRAKKCLINHSIEFDWCDIEQNPEECAFVEQVNGGKRRVPTIVFPDDSILVEPSNSILESKIATMRK